MSFGAATEPFAQAAPTRDTLHLWGAPAAGKTGLLGALYATSKSREPDRWEAHPKDCRDAYTQEQLLDAYEQLLDRAIVKTDVRKDGYRPLEFLLRQYRRGAASGDTLRLSIVDPAGEYSTRTELGLTEHGRSLFARVAHGGGLLWLFSAAPDGAPATLDRLVVLRHLVALLEASGGPQLGIPVGLCLSKVDALPPDRREAALADPRAALLAHLGPTTFTWFEAACPRLRCFAMSSAGTEPGRVRPVGLLPTLSWFAAEIGATPAADDAPSSAPAVAPPVVTPPASDVFATIEVPSVRPPVVAPAATAGSMNGARGVLASLASRFASAGAVPGGAPAEVGPLPVRDAAVFVPTPMYAPPEAAVHAPLHAAPSAPTQAMPAARREDAYAAPEPAILHADDVADDHASRETPDDAHLDAIDGPLRARLVRAALGTALALGAMGAGAWAGRAAILAAGARWQPPDAPPAAVRGVQAPDTRRFDREPVTDTLDMSDGEVDRFDVRPMDTDSLLRAIEAELASRRDEGLRFDTITVPEPPIPPDVTP
ncbi:MAG: hypothetical protein ACXW0Z_17365 [Gemmatirosa sp.]